MKTWRVVEFEIEARQEELAGWLMIKCGANGCEIDPSSEGMLRLRATFELDALPDGDLSTLTAALDEYGLNKCIASLRTSELQEEDWLAKWKEGFEPFPIGPELLVCPPWHQANLTGEQLAGRHVVLIEPGLAFGTGFHETTRFCMLALQDYAQSARKVLDVGTGSGILSISVALLSKSAKIIAVETDEVACKNARGNLELNGVSSRIELLQGSTELLLKDAGGTFDLMLCNLTYEDHIALLADYTALAAPGSHILFAGIIKEKGDLMSAALKKHNLKEVRRDDGAAWSGFVAQKI